MTQDTESSSKFTLWASSPASPLSQLDNNEKIQHSLDNGKSPLDPHIAQIHILPNGSLDIQITSGHHYYHREPTLNEGIYDYMDNLNKRMREAGIPENEMTTMTRMNGGGQLIISSSYAIEAAKALQLNDTIQNAIEQNEAHLFPNPPLNVSASTKYASPTLDATREILQAGRKNPAQKDPEENFVAMAAVKQPRQL